MDEIKILKTNYEVHKGIISFVVLALLFILSSYLFQKHEATIESLIQAHNISGALVFVLILVASIVFVPVSAMPLIPIASKLWGVPIAAALSVIGWTGGAMIAFWIAKKFGRPLVEKLIPLKKIEKMEKLIPETNVFFTIFFLRTVTPMDGLSYILGLFTYVETRTFFWATFLGLIPFCLFVAFLGSLPTIYLVIGLLFATVILGFGIYRKNHNHKKPL